MISLARFSHRVRRLEQSRIGKMGWLLPVVISGSAEEVKRGKERLGCEGVPHGPIVIVRIGKKPALS